MQDRKATQEGSVSPCPCEHTLFLQLFWSSTDLVFLQRSRLWSREHHIIFSHYNFSCSWQILLSRSRDRCFFVFPLSSNDEKTQLFRQPLSFYFFSPRLSFVPSQTRHPSCLLPWSLVSFSSTLISPECVCEPVRLMWNSVKPFLVWNCVSVSLLFEQWDIWIVKSVLVANKHFNRLTCSRRTPRILRRFRTSAFVY